jgi:hypothetical protein
MNNSKFNTDANNSNYEYTLDAVLTKYGSNFYLDLFNLVPFTLVSVVGFVLNTFSFVAFLDDEFKGIHLYSYLRVYCINNMIMCFLNIFNFVYSSIRILPWSNSFLTQLYSNYVYIPITNFNYFYGSLLDIVILLNRISYFNATVKNCIKFSPLTICSISFLVCLIVEFPFFFFFMPNSHTATLKDGTIFTIWFSDMTQFAQSTSGSVLKFLMYGLRDILVMLIILVLNVISTCLLKQHLSQKLRLVRYRMEELHISEGNAELSTSFGLNRISKADKRSSIMVIIMCILTIGEHLLVLLSVVYPYFNFDFNMFVFYTVNNFFWPVKRCGDFFLFFYFNKKFRKICRRYLSLIWSFMVRLYKTIILGHKNY